MSQTNIRPERVAVVSGGNRGIGLEVARELGQDGMTVLLGARDPRRGEAAAVELRAEDLDVRAVQLDVTDDASVGALRADLDRVDVLVNNAGILPHGLATELDPAVADAAWQTNALGAWRLALALIPLMRERDWGRIVNVSSGAGSLADMSTYEPPYSVSKAALNAITRVLAGGLQGTGILVNSVCPGWVQTDMGGSIAPRTVQQGAASVMWAVRLPDGGPSGGFFRDGEPVPW